MTKAELRIIVDARKLILAQEFIDMAKYYILDLNRYICSHKVLQMIEYICNSTVSATQINLDMLEALTYQYSDVKKVIIKRF